MKKRCISVALVLVMIIAITGCGKKSSSGGSKSDSDLKVDTSENTGDNKVNEDFSKNVNVNRASDYAKNELQLPIEGIGRGISTEVKADKEYKIVVMTRNSTNPYMVGMWAGGAQAGEDMGTDVQTLAPATQDSIEEQVTIMESLIEQDADAFVIHPSDSKGIQPVVDAANEKGIPVVAIGTAPETGAFMRTGVDYYETGYLVTKELCEAAGGKGKAIVLEGPAGVQNMEERKAGILDAIKEYPEVEVIASQTANCKRAEGMQVMENLLQGEKTADELTIVASCNDEMAIGAIQALKAQNVEGVFVGGADASKDATQAVKDGDLYVTYNTDPYGSTYLAVAYLVEYLNNGTLPEEYFVPFPAERHDPLITSKNVDEYMNDFKWYD
ncbi:sugar ABC transporter substrate-binding protein [Extibacter muris]|uniref:sugar ABC transporter substrate-binding protein n=1 Tax=Extibacter muris TaxID=1796622 RepID=UPI001D08CFC7|nr:sugar ABC transporter substrate-binding protein [Extibacter muris]MCB6202006.1 sugar ABC transporter substrate-binding protein [Extibacter muris]MCQ4663321.1 sugar ABC transporter substrate-binding protein [Extibacter muris]MCQ4692639.1 sugar ABC transporter substrate-binding protein [Extibacter muris]